MLDGAGGLQGWMERVENLPGVSFSESFMFSHDWKYHIISDPTNLIGKRVQYQMMQLIQCNPTKGEQVSEQQTGRGRGRREPKASAQDVDQGLKFESTFE